MVRNSILVIAFDMRHDADHLPPRYARPRMKAAVLNDYARPLDLEDVEIEPPRAGEVQVRIGATGVCHSDYDVIKGEWKYGPNMSTCRTVLTWASDVAGPMVGLLSH